MAHSAFLNNRFFHLLFLAVFCGFITLSLTPYGIATTVDSLSYLHAAKSVAQGKGVVVPDTDLASDAMEKPMTWWPPLYPVALSPFAATGSPEQGARIFNGIMLTTLSVTFLLLVARLGSPLLGLLGALWLAIQVPTLTLYTYAWSETLFLPLVLASYLFAIRYWEQNKTRDLVVATLLLSAACYTRYIGLAFVLPLAVMAWHGQTNRRTQLLRAGAVAGFVLLSLTPLFFRNISLSGDVSGLERAKATSSILANLTTAGDLLGMQLLGGVPGLVFILALAALFGGGLLVFAHLRRKKDVVSAKKSLDDILLPLFWALSYLGSIVILRSLKEFDLDTRTLSPVLPFAALCVAALTLWLTRVTRREWVALPFVAWALFLAMQGAAGYAAALSSWRNLQEPGFLAHDRSHYGNVGTVAQFMWMQPAYRDLSRRFQNPVVVIENYRPVVFAHLTNAPVKAFPAVLDDTAIERINRLGNGFVIITSDTGLLALEKYYARPANTLNPLPEFQRYNVVVFPLPLPTRRGVHKPGKANIP